MSESGNKRLQQTQAQVDEVVGIMKVNVEKVLERDQKLASLDDRAGKGLPSFPIISLVSSDWEGSYDFFSIRHKSTKID